MMKFFMVLVSLGLIGSALAKEVTFEFDVYSSGPKIYACNAGLVHKKLTGKICHIPGTETDENPFGTPCLPCQGADCNNIPLSQYYYQNAQQTNNCSCTAFSDGTYRMDYMKFQYQGMSTPKTVSAKNLDGTFSFLNTSQFETAQANAPISSIWNDEKGALKSVTFNLGSERYGAGYFIDICYKGAQIEYWADQIDAPNRAKVNITATDLTGGALKSYIGLAKPKVSVFVACDVQGKNTYVCASDKTGVGSLANAGDCFNGAYDANPGTANWIDENDAVWYPIVNQPIGNLALSGTRYINQFLSTTPLNYKNAPRFCVIRYYIEESNVAFERKWQRHDARFCTHTEIEEGEITEGETVTE